MKNKKLILADGDGVLLNWEAAFSGWMAERGYVLNKDAKLTYYIHLMYKDLEHHEANTLVRIFNESAAIGFLPALRDSMHYVRKLHEKHGYSFKVITSLSLDKNAQKLREINLRELFGSAISSVVCLDTGADKADALDPYKDSGLFWIEDKVQNSDYGHKIGLRSILMEHRYNMQHECPYPIVKNWKEIYYILTK